METYIKTLVKSSLFMNSSEKDLIKIFRKIPFKISNYTKDEIIAVEEDDCNNLGIILEGSIGIQKIFPSGQVTIINNFIEGNIFGEALIFSNNHKYPATITSTNNTKIMYIEKTNLINLLINNPSILNNFMSILSNRIFMLSQRISILSLDTIRKKISKFLLDEFKKQKTHSLKFNYTRKTMAEFLNIQRPSLSRELANMKKDGIIDFDSTGVEILRIDLLHEALFI